MKKFINLISSGLAFILSVIALFLGFSDVAIGTHIVIKSPLGTTTNDSEISAENRWSLFSKLGNENAQKYSDVGIVIIVFLSLAILCVLAIIGASFLKKKCKFTWVLGLAAMIFMVIAGIMYFAIPSITKEVLTVANTATTTTIKLGVGPICAGIFALIAGLLAGLAGCTTGAKSKKRK